MPLSHRDIVAIESKAADLIRQCSIIRPPVNVHQIAESLNLTVFPYKLNEVSGALIIESNQAYIGFNPTHGKERQRFTIAHEIGHYCLHCLASDTAVRKDQLFVDKDFIVKYRNANNYSVAELKQEQQANSFAAALLMPEEFIKAELEKPSYAKLEEIELINKLANLFEVSVPAMTFRLDNLNTLIYK